MVSTSLLLTGIALSASVVAGAEADDTTKMLHSPPVYPGIYGGRTDDDGWADAYSRAREFVSQLTLAEKVNMTTGVGWEMGLCVGNTGDLPRLGMRGLCLQDGPLGVRFADLITGFPAAITAGSTFNKQLIYDRGAAIAKEHKKKGTDIMLGPAVGPYGSKAAGGRNWEGFGSDASLQGIGSAQTVKGIQDQGIMANAKHWLMNEQEIDRNTISSNVDDRAMHEIYAWPFQDMIHAGLGSVMCSYNLINNSYGCENSYLLNGVLKDQFGFNGAVISDWEATRSGINSAISGMDMNMPGGGLDLPLGTSQWGWNMTVSVLNGSLPLDRVDDMVTRIMAAFYKVGLDTRSEELPNFSSWTQEDTGKQYPMVDEGEVVTVNQHVEARTKESRDIAYRVGLEGVTLLKNNGVLPLEKSKYKKVSILGKAAQTAPDGPVACPDMGCSKGALAGGWGSGQVNIPYFISPYDALNQKFIEQGSAVNYNFDESATDLMKQAAHISDLNIIFGLTDSGEGYITYDGNEGDRKNTTLWHGADEVIEAALNSSSNNVIVITSVGPVNMEKFIDHPNCTAVLFTLPPGQEGGRGVADVLMGEYNPSGRLPFTIAKDDAQYLPIINSTDYAENGFPQDNTYLDADLYVDYRHFDHYDIEPRFEFGFGLSYSNFTFGDLYLQPVHPPQERLPEPNALSDWSYDSQVPDASELVFPDAMNRIRGFLYPYLNATSDADKHDEEYPYPDGYSNEQPQKSHHAGGYSGGNKALWDIAFRAVVHLWNNGPYDGDYVGQLYIAHPQNEKYPLPPKQLRNFEKMHLANGQPGQMSFDILVRDLTVWDVELQQWVVPRGEYTVYIGSSSRNLEVQGKFTL